MAKAFGIVTSSSEYKVEGMQDYRSIGAFSFLGRYRVIDFPISNFSNSGIDNIQVYISSKPRSLVAHVGTGRHYNINSKRGQIQLLFPDEEERLNAVYNTNIQQFLANLDYIERMPQEYVVITPSCMVFTANYEELLNDHADSGSDITLLYHVVHHAKSGYGTCNVLDLDGNRVKSIRPNLGDENVKNIFMETFIMKKDLFVKLINDAKEISSMYNLAQIVDAKQSELDIRAVEHVGYFGPITSLKSYFENSLDLIETTEHDKLFNDAWPIYTRTSDSCPSRYYKGAVVKDSLISNGSSVKGTIEHSVIGRGVKVGKGAVIKNSIISAYVEIGENVHIENQIIDKYAKIIHENTIVADPETPGYIKHHDIL